MSLNAGEVHTISVVVYDLTIHGLPSIDTRESKVNPVPYRVISAPILEKAT